jgi:RNA polymerase subunit RPABC4/transcription elongation factor Spt4
MSEGVQDESADETLSETEEPDSEDEDSVFDDDTFWYKLDVDYEAAENKVADEEEDDEASDEDEDRPESIEEALLDSFVKRKKKIITKESSDYESVDEFRREVRNSDNPKELLNETYVNYLWIQNEDGDHFETENDSIDAIEAISDSEDLVREEITDEFDILWPGNATIGKELSDGEVVARRYLQAKPVVLKEGDEGFEVRGRRRDRNKVSKRLRSDEDVTEREPDETEESVIDKMERLREPNNDQFKIIGVDFDRSSLPESSRLLIKNERPVYADLEALGSKDIISFDGMSQVSEIYLKDTKYGGKFSVSIKHNVDGFQFELQATQKLDRKRERFKDGFNAITDLEFEKVYQYSAQDQKYLFNNILDEEGEAYDNYYDDLDNGLQGYIDDIVDTETVEMKSCKQCSKDFELETDECDDCGIEDFTESFQKTVLDVDDDEVASIVENQLEAIEPTHNRMTVSDWSVEGREMGRDIVRAEFNALLSERQGTTSEHHRVNIVPLGGRPKPGTIDNYLLECIFITYGKSDSKSYQNYGRLSLYDVLTSQNLEELVGTALHDTIIGLKDRILSKSLEAQETGDEYFDLVDELGPIHDNKDKLNEIYDPDNDAYFEKHVFYLLKALFNQTERWGREFQSEPDGLLIIPKKDSGEYFVATFDAKVSHAKGGYDLDKAEEDKALRYMLKEDTRNGIENKTGDEGISGHIFISQNIDKGDMGKISGNISENIEEYSGKRGGYVIFMEYRAILELFKLSQNHWKELGDSRIRGGFQQYVIDALTDETNDEKGAYVHFNMNSYSEVRQNLLDRISSFDTDQLEYYPGR